MSVSTIRRPCLDVRSAFAISARVIWADRRLVGDGFVRVVCPLVPQSAGRFGFNAARNVALQVRDPATGVAPDGRLGVVVALLADMWYRTAVVMRDSGAVEPRDAVESLRPVRGGLEAKPL